MGRLIDELEELGYVERRPDPSDRRAKLVVPTARYREELRAADRIIAGIESRCAAKVGPADYAEFRRVLRVLTGEPTVPPT